MFSSLDEHGIYYISRDLSLYFRRSLCIFYIQLLKLREKTGSFTFFYGQILSLTETEPTKALKIKYSV